MKTITIRELQINPTKALKELPVTLNRYGKPIAVISEVLRKTAPVVEELRNNVVQQAPRSKVKISTPTLTPQVRFDLCSKHSGSMKLSCGCP